MKKQIKIKFTYVDAVTGVSVAKALAPNGVVFPDVAGLEYAFTLGMESGAPVFYGQCDKGADLSIDGVLGEISALDYAADYKKAKAKEFDEARQSLLNKIAGIRYQKEVGGINFGGMKIDTSRSGQSMIATAYLSAQFLPSIDFKGANGWGVLTKEQIIAVAAAVSSHVQKHFSYERAHVDRINALDKIEDIQAYDPNANWAEVYTPTKAMTREEFDAAYDPANDPLLTDPAAIAAENEARELLLAAIANNSNGAKIEEA